MADDQGDGGWGQGLTYGLEMAIGIGLGAAVGYWWDKRHGSNPWGLLIGIGIGFVAGMYLLLKDMNRLNKDS